ncbi:MAG TPA: efflux transporter outer membrane subunit [Bryobacteraceae bacterium]|nr:efflux transporter outer membrane subunit [Bryobacteraceae bacterium]
MMLRITKFAQSVRCWLAFVAAAALVVLCSCNPAPKYSKPPVNAPQAFKESAPDQFKEGPGWKVAQPGDDKLRGKWWEMYNDPVLNSLEEQVQISNQTVIQAEANFRAARALVVSARSALFPTIGAAPSYTNSRFSSTTRTAVVTPGSSVPTGTPSSGGATTTTTSGSGTSNVVNSFSLPFEITYTVDFWHRIRNQVAANAFSAQASAADVATALLSTHAALAEDYFEVRALDAQEGILQDTLKNYRDALNLTTTLFNAGIDSDEEVAQARTQLDTATAEATDLGVARAQFEHAIATLMGKPAAEFSLPVAPFIPNPPQIPVAVPSEMLERRPDIAAAERQVAAANAEIGIARAAYYPNLTLSATGGFQTSHFTEWFTWPSRFWSLGPTLSQTLLDFGARRGLNEQAEASYDASVASYRQTVLSDFQSVEDQLSALRIYAQEVSQYETAIHSSAHFLELSLTRFRTGVDSYLNVITAQNAVLNNRETQVATQLKQMNASVSLIMALGGGWDASQLPQMKDLLAKPGKWSPNGTAIPAGQLAPANPPVVAPIALPPGAQTGTSTRPPGASH